MILEELPSTTLKDYQSVWTVLGCILLILRLPVEGPELQPLLRWQQGLKYSQGSSSSGAVRQVDWFKPKMCRVCA